MNSRGNVPVDWDTVGTDSVDYGKLLTNTSTLSKPGNLRNPFDSLTISGTSSLGKMDKLGLGTSTRSLNSFMSGNRSEMDSENFMPAEQALQMLDKDGEANMKFNETAKSFSIHASRLDDPFATSTIGRNDDVSGIQDYFLGKSDYPLKQPQHNDSLSSFIEKACFRGNRNQKPKQDFSILPTKDRTLDKVKEEPIEIEQAFSAHDFSLSSFINSSKSNDLPPDAIIDLVSRYSKWKQEQPEQDKKFLISDPRDTSLVTGPSNFVENKENHDWSIMSNRSTMFNQNLPGIMEVSSMTSFENDSNLNSSTPIKRRNLIMESTSLEANVERETSNVSSERARDELRKLSDIHVPEHLLRGISSKLNLSQDNLSRSQDLQRKEIGAKQPVERDLFQTSATKKQARESKVKETFREPVKLPRSASGSGSSSLNTEKRIVLSSAIQLNKNQGTVVDSEDDHTLPFSNTIKEKAKDAEADSSVTSHASRGSSGCSSVSVGCMHHALQVPQQYLGTGMGPGGSVPLIGVPIFIACPMHQCCQPKDGHSTTCQSTTLQTPATPMGQFMNFFPQYQTPCPCNNGNGCRHEEKEPSKLPRTSRFRTATTTTSTNTTIQEIKSEDEQDLIPTDLMPKVGSDKACIVFCPTRVLQKDQATITVVNQTDYQIFVRCGLYHKMQTKVFQIQNNSTKAMEKEIEFILPKRGEKILVVSFEPTAETKYVGELLLKCRFAIGLAKETSRRIYSNRIPLTGTGLSSFGIGSQFKNY